MLSLLSEVEASGDFKGFMQLLPTALVRPVLKVSGLIESKTAKGVRRSVKAYV